MYKRPCNRFHGHFFFYQCVFCSSFLRVVRAHIFSKKSSSLFNRLNHSIQVISITNTSPCTLKHWDNHCETPALLVSRAPPKETIPLSVVGTQDDSTSRTLNYVKNVFSIPHSPVSRLLPLPWTTTQQKSRNSSLQYANVLYDKRVSRDIVY